MRPVFDSMCTHLIHCGKASELPKEARLTRASPLFIVSAQWLRECMSQGAHVSESLFPYSYDERNALQTVASESKPGTTNSYAFLC